MAEERKSDLLGALPRTRPHRRSNKRPVRADADKPPVDAGAEQRGSARAVTTPKPTKRPRAANVPASPNRAGATASAKRGTGDQTGSGRLRQPPQPRGIPSAPRSPVPPAPSRPEVIGTAIQAVAELTEIGLSMTARALRRTLSRLPRP